MEEDVGATEEIVEMVETKILGTVPTKNLNHLSF